MENLRLKTIKNIPVDDVLLTGELGVPQQAKGIVVFAHGSGSSRHSPRNRFVAEALQKAGFATLLFDLLTVKEDRNYDNRFNIDLLTDRLVKVTDWLRADPDTADFSIGYFGASTGSAATLKAAAQLEHTISAVVSRGGRPDMADVALEWVNTPTLFIVGSLDHLVIELNQRAFALLRSADKAIRVIPGAGHLFEEAGKLEEVASITIEWFDKYLITEKET